MLLHLVYTSEHIYDPVFGGFCLFIIILNIVFEPYFGWVKAVLLAEIICGVVFNLTLSYKRRGTQRETRNMLGVPLCGIYGFYRL
jgi:hypothetical protein